MNVELRHLFLRFLELKPIRNNHNNLKTSFCCFYSSELKSIKQVKTLMVDGPNTIDTSTSDTKSRRYYNTLQNLGLYSGNSKELAITKYGRKLRTFLQTQSNIPNKPENDSALLLAVEDILVTNLLDIKVQNKPELEKAFLNANKVFSNLELFLQSLPEQELQTILSASATNLTQDLKDKLYFLQIIFSSGCEVKRFFALSEQEQAEILRYWSAIDKAEFARLSQDDIFEQMIHTYMSPKINKTIQPDIVYRLLTIIQSYYRHKQTSSTGYSLPTPSQLHDNGQPNQLIVCGCPGSGKSTFLKKLLSEQDHVTRITFYPDYDYSDLIGTYRPTPVYKSENNIQTITGEHFPKGVPYINYDFIPGPLIRCLIFAIKNPKTNIILIIEELNRTNCNAVFGDFFHLLDRDADGKSAYELSVSPELSDFLQQHSILSPLRLPKNLYIWGTMNSADQGVYPLDSAFRRRWHFVYKGYNEPCVYDGDVIQYGGDSMTWGAFRKKINNFLIGLDIHEDKLIGPYFLSQLELSKPEIVANKLFLYLWEDVLRFHRTDFTEAKSFAQFLKEWNDGNGAPIKNFKA